MNGRFTGFNGAHCGLSDWYPENEKTLLEALKSEEAFDTGWYSSKKEIASARISSDNGDTVLVEVSVSDDFDTEGRGQSLVFGVVPFSLEGVRDAISRAWTEAESNQKDNREYRGYSILRYYVKRPAVCFDYYLVNCSEYNDRPPGDNYYHWGWQDSDDNGKTPLFKIPKNIACKFEEHALSYQDEPLRIGVWEIKPWE